jgi:hypothetical protein
VIADHLAGHPRYSVTDAIVWEIRLPRVLLAAVVGAALTTAGTVVQVLVRNALADPFLLGVSSGTSVGATAVLLFGTFASLGIWAISVGSVLGALGAMAAVFLVSRSGRALAPTQLLPAPRLRRGHPRPAQRPGRGRHRALAAPGRLRPARRRLVTAGQAPRERPTLVA